MKSYEQKTLEFILQDKDFQDHYNNNLPLKMSFEDYCRETTEYCFNSEFDPFQEERYRCYGNCYLEFKGYSKAINIEDIFDYFASCIDEDKRWGY